MVAVLEDSAHCGSTTAPIRTWFRRLRLGLLLTGLLGAMAYAEATPSDHSDARAAHNSAYLELGGTGLLWSANYDRMFGEHFSLHLGVEALSIYSFCDCHSSFFGIPVAASALVGPGAHKFELGLGATTFIGTTDYTGYKPDPIIFATGIAGYRYAPEHSGLMFRASFTPILAYAHIGSRGLGSARAFAFPWAGLSVGYQF